MPASCQDATYSMNAPTLANSKGTASGGRELALVGLALALLAAAALRPSIHGVDGVGHYVYLASLLVDGDLDLAGQYRRFDELRDYPFSLLAEAPVSPVTGRAANRYGVGAALLWSPAVAVTHLGLRLAAPERADGVGRPYEWAVGVATAFWASLALLLLYARARRAAPAWAAGAMLAGLVLTTPLGFYIYAHGSMGHGASFFAVTAGLLAVERAWDGAGTRALGWSALAGGLLALIVIVRFQDASWALVLGAALVAGLAQRRRSAREWLALAATGGGGALIVLLPQMWAWNELYGSWLAGPMPYLDDSAGRFEPWPRHFVAALFSARAGALLWHPLLGLGLAALAWAAARAPGRLRALAWVGLVGFVAQAWVVGSWSVWWAGASFGNRFFISSLPALGLGLAWGAGRLRRPAARAAVLVLLVLLIVWNMGLLVQYAVGMVPREDDVAWGRVVRQNLVDVPRLVIERIR